MSINQLESAAGRYRSLKDDMKRLEKEVEALRAELVAIMDEKCVEKFPIGSYEIRYDLRSKPGIDSARLKADYPEIAAAYTKIITYPYFEVVELKIS